jgi:hypothetical protein
MSHARNAGHGLSELVVHVSRQGVRIGGAVAALGRQS